MKPLSIVAIVVAGLFAQSARAADGAKLFDDNCAACHSIGGGDGAGPDLSRATQFAPADLQKAVTRMQQNAGPLQPAQIDALVAFLKSKAGAQVKPAAVVPVGLPDVGRQLFFGARAFANGGTPCFACHSVAGSGGNLAADLTGVFERRGEASIVSTAQQPAIPLMKAAYAAHPLTAQEAGHLAAFFRAEGGVEPARSKDAGVVHGTAAGVAILLFAAVSLVVRRRIK